METSAKRAQMIKDTLDDQARTGNDERSIQARIDKLRPRFNKEREVRELVNDLEAQRRSHIALRESLERFKVNMARLNASLALMRNRLVEMSAAGRSRCGPSSPSRRASCATAPSASRG